MFYVYFVLLSFLAFVDMPELGLCKLHRTRTAGRIIDYDSNGLLTSRIPSFSVCCACTKKKSDSAFHSQSSTRRTSETCDLLPRI